MGSNDSRWKECLVGNRETQYTRITSVWAEHCITRFMDLTLTLSDIYQDGIAKVSKKRYGCDVTNDNSKGKYVLL